MTLNPTQPTPRLHRAAPSFMSRPGPTGDAPRLAPPDPAPAVVAALSRWARDRREREVAAVVRWSGDRRRRAEARDHARACEALTASAAARGVSYPAYGVPEVAASGARQVRCHAGSCQLQDSVDSCLSRHAKTSAPENLRSCGRRFGGATSRRTRPGDPERHERIMPAPAFRDSADCPVRASAASDSPATQRRPLITAVRALHRRDTPSPLSIRSQR